jgi:hypothetical protein
MEGKDIRVAFRMLIGICLRRLQRQYALLKFRGIVGTTEFAKRLRFSG